MSHELMQAMTLVLQGISDIKNPFADVLFFHAQADLEDEMCDLVKGVYENDMARRLFINGLSADECRDAHVNYLGAKHLISKLDLLGIPEEKVFCTPSALFTYKEAEAIQEICAQESWNSLIIAAAPYHILRCVLTHLAVMKNEGRYFSFYPVTLCGGIRWGEQIITKLFGGETVVGARFQKFESEWDRIERYTKAGHCVPIAEMIEYFKNKK